MGASFRDHGHIGAVLRQLRGDAPAMAVYTPGQIGDDLLSMPTPP
jgi:hypothetical protein